MFLISGKRKIRIKKYFDTNEQCAMCKSVGFRFSVKAEYFHLYFIPCFPIGEKEVDVKCEKCGYGVCSGASKNHYLSITRNPFYLYAGPLLFIALITAVVLQARSDRKQEAMYMAEPKIGDVYRIRQDMYGNTFCSFMRVARISKDSVYVYRNTSLYISVAPTFGKSDYFVSREVAYAKDSLKKLYISGGINEITRDYGDEEGYNRIRQYIESK